jgi:hypothetical protein
MDDTKLIFRNAETVIPTDDNQLFTPLAKTAVCLNRQILNKCWTTAYRLGSRDLEDQIRTV